MERNLSVYEQAFEYHKSGFHCAEAVSKAVRTKLKNIRHNPWLFLHRLI